MAAEATAAYRVEERLGNVVRNFDSRRVPLSSRERQQRQGKIPYFGAAGCIDYVDSHLFEGLHLLVGEDGSVVKGDGTPFLQLVSGQFWVNNHAHVLRGADDLDTRFVYYALSTSNIAGLITGAVQPKLTQANLNSIPIPFPARATREGVVKVLGALDDKIELNRRMNATLEAMARALFQSWFVNFDPVRAKAEDCPPAGLDEVTAALFPSQFQDSVLGAIPRGWEASPLDKIASVTMGLSPKGESYNACGKGVSLINGPVEFGEYFPKRSKWTTEAARLSKIGDLIFCVRGSTTGRRVISDGEYALGRGVCSMRADRGCRSFLYQTIEFGLDRLLGKTTGSVFPSLSAPDIKGFVILKPTMDLVSLYESRTKPLIERIEMNHRESHTLATLRDTLLPELLSGRLSVKDVPLP